MIFTSFVFPVFLLIVFSGYWLLRKKTLQNLFLLVVSYIFYGWVHPWFCILMSVTSVIDYACSLGFAHFPKYRRLYLVISLVSNLGMLSAFKYYNFFMDNFQHVLQVVGLSVHPSLLQVVLPVGISFYTFQALSYTIDVYKGKLEPRKNLIDFLLFISFFPHLVAGPIMRATILLPQIEKPRRWDWQVFRSAWPLIIQGYLKKLVIADNVSIYVDKVFGLQSPTLLLLVLGTLAFAIQIYMDFSAYTDIARGTARLLGFELVENFNAPYLALSPSDFWRRWHISFSSWIMEYLYIPLGGSRVGSRWKFALVVLTTMGLSGLWHGAAWNFVLWGIYHGILLYIYHQLGMGGRWRPQGWWRTGLAWAAMFSFTMFGWLLFRTHDMAWLARALGRNFNAGFTGDALLSALAIAGLLTLYSLPLLILALKDRLLPDNKWVHGFLYGFAIVAIMVYCRETQQDFIYFQF